MASMVGVMNTFSTQTSMAAPEREAGDAYTVSERRSRRGRLPESRDHSFESTPHPAYGSELSTGGGRLVRALTAMEPTRHPFPVSSTARTIGEQKAKVNTFHGYFTEVHSGSMLLLPVGASGYGAHDALGFSW